MGKDFYTQFASYREVFEEAEDLLSWKISDLIFSGDSQELALTKNCQVAIYITSMAMLRVIEEEVGSLDPVLTAGLSLGEYSALTAAKKISFVDCLELVQLRGLYMHQAALEEKGTMVAVLGLQEEEIAEALDGLDLWVANINCPGQIVVSGRRELLELGTEKLKIRGAKRVIPLDVSGAFHTELMRSAKEKLEPKICAIPFHPSNIDVVMNVTGNVASSVEEMRKNLILQVIKPVRWEASIREIEKRSPALYVEIGPGATLAGMNKKNQVTGSTISIGKVGDLKLLEEAYI
jgi:[acyl-carrier-protein] S-malonyltransferase